MNQDKTNRQFIKKIMSQRNEEIPNEGIEIPAPLTKKDRLFIKASYGDKMGFAWFQPWRESLSGYADNYATSVDILYEAVKNERVLVDQTACSFIFLARQCIELRLKALILMLGGNITKGQKAKKECFIKKLLHIKEVRNSQPTHELLALWEKFDELYFGEKDNDSYRAAKSIIQEFHREDKSSTAFRYPQRRRLKSCKQRFYDIANFYSTFKKLDLFLNNTESEVEATTNKIPI